MPYVLAIVPTVGVGTLFYFVIKSILEGDRRERLAQARWEAEHDRARQPPRRRPRPGRPRPPRPRSSDERVAGDKSTDTVPAGLVAGRTTIPPLRDTVRTII